LTHFFSFSLSFFFFFVLSAPLSHKEAGLLPRVLTQLLQARARVKEELKKEKDPFKKAVLDGRQNAIKITCAPYTEI
jgi:DNA polymerase elongation subunit (family B)